MSIYELNNEDWEKIYNQSPIGIVFVDKDYRWIKVNNTISELLEYSEAELLTKKVHDLTHPEDLQPDLIMSNKVAKGEIPGFQMVKRFITKRGNSVWVRMTAWGVFDENTGKFQHFIRHIQPLLNGEKAKVEAIGKHVEIRNVYTLRDLLMDNWKSIIVAICTFISASIGIGINFWITVEKVNQLQIKLEKLEESKHNGQSNATNRLGNKSQGN